MSPPGASVLHNCFTLHVLLQVRTLWNLINGPFPHVTKVNLVFCPAGVETASKASPFLRWSESAAFQALTWHLWLSVLKVALVSVSGSSSGKRRFPLMLSQSSMAARGRRIGRPSPWRTGQGGPRPGGKRCGRTPKSCWSPCEGCSRNHRSLRIQSSDYFSWSFVDAQRVPDTGAVDITMTTASPTALKWVTSVQRAGFALDLILIKEHLVYFVSPPGFCQDV